MVRIKWYTSSWGLLIILGPRRQTRLHKSNANENIILILYYIYIYNIYILYLCGSRNKLKNHNKEIMSHLWGHIAIFVKCIAINQNKDSIGDGENKSNIKWGKVIVTLWAGKATWKSWLNLIATVCLWQRSNYKNYDFCYLDQMRTHASCVRWWTHCHQSLL